MHPCDKSIVRTFLVGATALTGAVHSASAVVIPLEANATASFSQGGFSPDFAVDGIFNGADAGGTGWALAGSGSVGNTNSATAVFKPIAPLAAGSGYNLTFNMFQGGFTNHTLGNFRLAYTTDPSASFGNGADNGGTVAANWTTLLPTAATSTNAGSTPNFRMNPDGTIFVFGPLNNLDTYLVTAPTGPLASAITGFRLEALETNLLAANANGPGRSANGNIVLREFSVDAVAAPLPRPGQVLLTNATAVLSQSGFSVDNVIDNKLPTANTNGVGWANNGVDLNNVATFETQTTTPDGASGSLFTFELFSGGFGTHEIGKFRISATDADRSLFADGNDNGGAGVGAEPIWTVLDITSITSSNGTTTFTELPDHTILVNGNASLAEFETFFISASGGLSGITGFRLETFTDPSLPSNGPGFGPANGNFVIREFTVTSVIAIPEPSTLVLLSLGGLMLRRRRMA